MVVIVVVFLFGLLAGAGWRGSCFRIFTNQIPDNQRRGVDRCEKGMDEVLLVRCPTQNHDSCIDHAPYAQGSEFGKRLGGRQNDHKDNGHCTEKKSFKWYGDKYNFCRIQLLSVLFMMTNE